MSAPNLAGRVRVFIGTEPKTEIARLVLQTSIVRNTEMKVDFIPMIGRDWEYVARGIKFGTGFSLRRWMIPAYCGWEGRAIYLDADMLVFGDIWDLWTHPERTGTLGFRGGPRRSLWCTQQPDRHSQAARPQASVMVIDCAAAKDEWGWYLPKVLAYLREHPAREDYLKFMYLTPPWTKATLGRLPDEWNHLDRMEKGTKLIHYTRVPDQPWYNPGHEHAYPWRKALIRAIQFGAIPRKDFEAALARYKPNVPDSELDGLHPHYEEFYPDFSKRGSKYSKGNKAG